MLEGGHHTAKRLHVEQLRALVLLVDVALLEQNGIKRHRPAECHEVMGHTFLLAPLPAGILITLLSTHPT